MNEGSEISFRLRTHLDYEVLAVALVLVLAAVTRLYHLGTFPSFPPQFPWLGNNPSYPGLYTDEAKLITDVSLFPHALNTYEPSYGILLIKAAQFILGQNYLADRLPSALASIFTSVMIYFTGKQFYKTKGAALVSSLYFVVMAPAIVYGRMDLYENFVAPLLVVTLFGIAKFENGGGRRWLYLAALGAAFAPLGKVDGVFVTVFFSIWALTSGKLRQKVFPLIVSWGPIAAGGAVIISLVGSFQGVLSQWFFGLVGRELSIQFLFIQSMPSGYVAFDTGYIKPDFWYIFGFICLGVLLLRGSSQGKLLLEGLFSFVAVSFLSFGIGAYYVMAVFPLMALAAGGGVGYLTKVGNAGALAMYTFLYAPLVASVIASTSLPFIGINYALFALKLVLFVVPALVWLALEAVSRLTSKRHFPLSLVLLVCFFAVLLVSTPELYSYFFLGTAP